MWLGVRTLDSPFANLQQSTGCLKHLLCVQDGGCVDLAIINLKLVETIKEVDK